MKSARVVFAERDAAERRGAHCRWLARPLPEDRGGAWLRDDRSPRLLRAVRLRTVPEQHQLARGHRVVYDDTYTLDLTWTTN